MAQRDDEKSTGLKRMGKGAAAGGALGLAGLIGLDNVGYETKMGLKESSPLMRYIMSNNGRAKQLGPWLKMLGLGASGGAALAGLTDPEL